MKKSGTLLLVTGLWSPVLLDSVYYCYYCPVALVGVAERGAGLETLLARNIIIALV